MDSLWWLVIANASVWLGLGGYVAFLGLRQKSLAKALAGAGKENDD